MNDAPIIEVHDLWKTFRAGDVSVHALRGVNLSVEKGEFVAVVGPSGSGKSTLFHILGGLTSPTSGLVSIDGHNLANLTNAERTRFRKETVGFVFQKYNLLPTLTAEDNIHLVQYVAGWPTKFAKEFAQVLDSLGVSNRLKHKPRGLSGGQQQRIAIARAIVNGPAILLADEPTGNLDSQNAIAVLDLLKDFNERLGQTILLITHDPDAASYSSRRIQMRDGQVVDCVRGPLRDSTADCGRAVFCEEQQEAVHLAGTVESLARTTMQDLSEASTLDRTRLKKTSCSGSGETKTTDKHQ